MNWLSGILHGQGFGCLWRPARFSDDEQAFDGIRAKGRRTISDCFDMIETKLRPPFAVGGAFTAVDPFLLVFYRWGAAIGIEMSTSYPQYSAFALALSQRVSVKSALAAENTPGEHRTFTRHSLLFPESLCVVHHGGIGTTAEAMRAGKAQIVVPFFGDQPDHGARVERLGVGLAIRLSAYDERRAVAALQELIAGNYPAKAKGFAKLVAMEKGVESIVEWAEDMSAKFRHA